MKVFSDIKLTWAGKAYTIPANRVLEAIARIEDHVSLVELTRYQQERGTIPLARLALAFHAAVTFAGADKVTAEEVYRGMFSGAADQRQMLEAVQTLMIMMVPPDALKKAGETTKPGKSRPGGARSSRKSTKRS